MKRRRAVPDREIPIRRYTLDRSPLLRGAARLLDVGAVLDRPLAVEGEEQMPSVVQTLASDWAWVGRDMWVAIGQAAEESGLAPDELLPPAPDE